MWAKKKHVEDTKAFLGKGAEFIGKLIFKGNVRIDGDFQGEIYSSFPSIIRITFLIAQGHQRPGVFCRSETRYMPHRQLKYE